MSWTKICKNAETDCVSISGVTAFAVPVNSGISPESMKASECVSRGGGVQYFLPIRVDGEGKESYHSPVCNQKRYIRHQDEDNHDGCHVTIYFYLKAGITKFALL